MRFISKVLKWLLGLVVAVLVGATLWLYVAPPALIRVAAGYSAKIVCSNVFVAGRDAGRVLELDVQAPGHPILKFIDVDVDTDRKTVTAGLFGVFGRSMSIARDGFGCAAVADGDLDAVPPMPTVDTQAALTTGIWPEGIAVEVSQDPDVQKILDDPAMTGPGMRAVVVVKNGRIVAERYGEGFTLKTPLLGWSMTKSVNAAIIGTAIQAGKLSLDKAPVFASWAADARRTIRLADLMAMSSGLEFNEDYGDVTDVTRMLYLEPDMAGFAKDKPAVAAPGSLFNYSSGTAVMIARAWQDALGAEALTWPRNALFGPIGMTSAVLETDARGTFVGSSYLYATARDWARFGLFIEQNGVWNETRILPEGFVDTMRAEAAASKGEYGQGQVWLHGPDAGTPPGEDPDKGFDLPADAFWFLGHDGQSTAVIPSQRLVVVRLGLTPSKLGYKPQAMVAALAKALP